MSTISLHFKKHKITQVNGIGRHVERVQGQKHSNKNIKDERTQDNITLYGGRDEGTYHKRAKKQIEEKYTGKRAIRKDAVAMVSTTVQFGGAIQGATEVQQVAVLTDCYRWLSNRFGEDNTLGASIHLDETNPHLHYDFMPWRDGKLQAKNIINREGLQSAQDELLEYVQSKYPQYDFTRMSEDERGFSNGKSQEDFERLKDAKREGVEAVQNGLAYVKNAADTMSVEWEQIQQQKQEQEKREKELDVREGGLNSRETILKARESDLMRRELRVDKKVEKADKTLLEASERLEEANRLAEYWKKLKEQTEGLQEQINEKLAKLGEVWQKVLRSVRSGKIEKPQVEQVVEKHVPLESGKDVDELTLDLSGLVQPKQGLEL